MKAEKRQGILAGGSILVDHVFMIDSFPKEEGTLTLMTKVSQCIGGAPLNVLVTLARLGVTLPLGIIGIVGADTDADYVRTVLKAHQINDTLIRTGAQRTAYTHVLNARDTGQRTFFHEAGANAVLALDCFESVETRHKIFHLGYLLILDALDQTDSEYGSVSARLFAHMKQKGYLTSLDLVSAREPERFDQLVKPCLPYVDFLIINEWEAQMLTAIPMRDDCNQMIHANVRKASHALLALGVNQWVIIHAPEGGWAQAKEGTQIFIPSYPLNLSEIKGTVGAGDAFCAGMLFALHESIPIEMALKIAHTCAYFNLHAANSVDGTKSIETVMDFIACH